jgi:hypothetical protein
MRTRGIDRDRDVSVPRAAGALGEARLGGVDGDEYADGDDRPYAEPRSEEPAEELEPNGGIVAAIVAAGVGCAALGVCTVVAAAVRSFADFLTLYAPSGPLTGKATVATLIYLIAWVNLHARLRYRELSLFKGFLVAMALLGVGLIGTFPPFYQLFHQ